MLNLIGNNIKFKKDIELELLENIEYDGIDIKKGEIGLIDGTVSINDKKVYKVTVRNESIYIDIFDRELVEILNY